MNNIAFLTAITSITVRAEHGDIQPLRALQIIDVMATSHHRPYENCNIVNLCALDAKYSLVDGAGDARLTRVIRLRVVMVDWLSGRLSVSSSERRKVLKIWLPSVPERRRL